MLIWLFQKDFLISLTCYLTNSYSNIFKILANLKTKIRIVTSGFRETHRPVGPPAPPQHQGCVL